MKKWLIAITILLVLAIAGTGLWFYFKLNRKSELINYIPEDVNVLFYANFKQIIKNRISYDDNSRNREFTEILRAFAPELEYLKDADIDPFGDAAIFEWNGSYFLAFMINSEDGLNELLIKNKIGKKLTVNNRSWTLCSGKNNVIQWFWNDKVLYLCLNQNQSKNDLYEKLSQTGSNNFGKSQVFARCTNDKALIWFYARVHPFSDEFPIKGIIDFKQDLNIEAGTLNEDLNKGLNLDDPLPSYQTVFISDSGKNRINKWMELLYVMNDRSKEFIPLNSKNHNFYNCRKLIIYDSSQIIRKEYIRYEFDENFEKKAVKTFTWDTVPGVSLYFGKNKKDIQIISYNKADSSAFGNLPENLTVYWRFNDSFIRNIYNSPMSFLCELKGIRTQNGYRYSVKINIQSKRS